MNDHDVRTAVRESGLVCRDDFREHLETLLLDARAGRALPTALAAQPEAHRPRHGLRLVAITTAAAALIAGAVIMLSHDGKQTITGVTPTVAPTVTPTAPPTIRTTDGSTVTTSEPTTTAPTTSQPTGNATTRDTAVVTHGSTKLPLVATVVADLHTRPEGNGGVPVFEFQPDGLLLVLDPRTSTVTAVRLDGGVAWTAQVPAKAQAAPVDVALGPDGVLYISYSSTVATQEYTVSAVPYSGPSAGTSVREWTTTWTCSETSVTLPESQQNNYCGHLELRADGFALSATETAPFVDAQGRPSGATFVPRSTITVSDPVAAGEAMRSDVSSGGHTWTVEATDPIMGEAGFVTATAQPGGGALLTMGVADHIPASDVIYAAVIARPDGTMTQYLLPMMDLVGLRIAGEGMIVIDNVIYAVDMTNSSYRLIRLDPQG